jgi:tRNA(Arg) A34 adenosine deaminase TadA
MDVSTFIERALCLATENIESGGGPFGAVIVKDGKIISEGVNRVTETNDPTAHAEVQAIRQACNIMGTFDLPGCEIYCSCEPCPMCFSAIYWAHISKVYYAATHHDAEDAGFADALIYREVRLKPVERSIPFIKIEHPEKSAPFIIWNNKVDKKRY